MLCKIYIFFTSCIDKNKAHNWPINLTWLPFSHHLPSLCTHLWGTLAGIWGFFLQTCRLKQKCWSLGVRPASSSSPRLQLQLTVVRLLLLEVPSVHAPGHRRLVNNGVGCLGQVLWSLKQNKMKVDYGIKPYYGWHLHWKKQTDEGSGKGHQPLLKWGLFWPRFKIYITVMDKIRGNIATLQQKLFISKLNSIDSSSDSDVILQVHV